MIDFTRLPNGKKEDRFDASMKTDRRNTAFSKDGLLKIAFKKGE